MSQSIDQRIVSMKFDNAQFQSGVSDTLNSVNKLKSGLNFSDSARSFDSISASANRVSFDGLSSGLETVRVKFSALQVAAVTALANITNSAINTGKQMLASLTTDPIKEGFREYETQMNAIQTILANTSSKGTTLTDVKKSLAELNEYSDKTIYNFTEMTKNIGTFTAAGISLDKSTTAIKGIANLAAMSGSNSEQASTAMYQLSQALAAGTVKLQDWNSVVNAGMGGEVFQNALKDTARVHGIAVDQIIKDEGSFRESLSKGWVTSEILTETLSKFTGDLSAAQLKTMGYNEEQIKGIMKMAQTANDAATKVKTVTQLMDTLKEAVGSGWAQTWQTVFGDFEEAKVLFTNVSNVIGGMIGKTSEARNSMLNGWKDLGGRTALIDAVKNAFDGLMGVVKAISGAFRDVFPATTSQQLFNITNGLKSFTENLKLSDSTLSNIRSTLKGAFAILDIGKTILLAVANSISIMLGGAGDLTASILGVTGSFGEWLTALDNTIKKSDVINKVLTTLAYGIKNGFSSIAYVFDIVVKGIEHIGEVANKYIKFPGFDDLYSLLELIGRRMTFIGKEADNMALTVGGAFILMGKYIASSKIGEAFITIYDTIKKITDAIVKLIGKLASTVSDAIKNADFSSMLDGIAAMSIGGMLLAFKKFMKSLKDTVGDSKGFLSNITGALDGVRGSLTAWQQNLKAGVLIKLATAVGILAASIVAISLIDSAKLVGSLTAIGTLFAQLLVAMKLYSMIGEFKGAVIKSSIVMLAMSTSILILSGAMNNLSKLDWNGLAKGVTGVAALAGILVASAKILSSGSGAMIKGSSGMVIFAAAIKILASACIDLSNLSWESLTKGLVGVGVLMGEISLFLKTATFSSKMALTATGIVILAAAMKILASACSDFGSMAWSEISKGLTSVGALLTEITMFSKLNADSKGMISTSIGITILSAAMKILASAMSDFGSLSWNEITKGLTAMGVALTEITIAMKLIPSDILLTAGGLVVVASAMKILASAMSDFGGMSWDEITKGLTAMGGSLTILSVGLNVMKGTLSGSAALLVAAGALAILAPALAILGAMTWESIIKGLFELAGVISIFGLSALVLTPVIPSMLGLSGALVLLGVSMLGIGAGLALVGLGLAGVATGLTLLAGTTAAGATAIVASLSIIIVGVAALVPAMLEKIGEGIVALLKVITESIPEILKCVTTIIKAVLDCIVTNTPLILDSVLKILNQVLDALIKWAPITIQKIVTLMIELLKVIRDYIPQIITVAVEVIVAFVQGIADNIVKVIDVAFKLIISFINGLADAIRNNSEAIGSACVNLVDAIVNGIGSLGGKFVEAGANAVKGFIKGLASLPGKLLEAGADLANQALGAAKEALGIHSPSREFAKLGVFSGKGFINGLDSYSSKVGYAASAIGYNAIDSMSNAISSISDIVNGNIDSNPVIRPVLDLTDIQNGSKQLYDSFNNPSLDNSISINTAKARSISNGQSYDSSEVSNKIGASTVISPAPKQPVTLQLLLSNGRAIAEYIIDDLDTLTGNRNNITGRMVGL